ncbi:MAG: hypothetical protein [Wendovervirus sonii]|uniref:Uncharacterized protein n=1 Tax=phage Lak_Megaphage_Sonny TaxID=3109229 RepID=A0ABZ0Z654_9CAUD|nr:MAG: hypothetical protein [phage Lak_Megaphage_Sonny]
MDINIKNRKKYAEYAKLLWEFAYAANNLKSCSGIGKEDFSVHKVIDGCFREHYKILDKINAWEFDWGKTDFNSMINVGDCFIKKHVEHATLEYNVSYTLIHVTRIEDAELHGETTKLVYYQSAVFTNNAVIVNGKDISNCRYGNYDNTMYLIPMCADIFDGTLTKIDKSEWDAALEVAKNINVNFEKYGHYFDK